MSQSKCTFNVRLFMKFYYIHIQQKVGEKGERNWSGTRWRSVESGRWM